jgi:hypothetical protein
MPQKIDSSTFSIYLAGFLDGDGSIYVRAKPNSSYKYGYQVAPTVAFFQSGKNDMFPNLCKRIGFGTMRLRKDNIFEYTISKQEEIRTFLEHVLPYLVLKQEQARLMLKILNLKAEIENEDDFNKLLALIDSFRELNYSKNRKVRTLTP